MSYNPAPSIAFSDITGKPTTKAGYGITDVPLTTSLATVATAGTYSSLTGKPTIPVVTTGSYSTTGIALQLAYAIPHSLGYTPSYVGVSMGTVGAALPYFISWDGTNITVTYATAPGVVALTVKWFSIQ